MQPFPKPGDFTPGPISKVPFDPKKIPKIPTGGWSFSCSTNPVQALLNKALNQTTPATVALIPNEDSNINPISVADTPITFKAIDKALKALVTEWHPDLTVPKFTKAYATFSKALFLGSEHDAILFITNGKTAHLYIKILTGSHVWTAEAKLVYCKKGVVVFL